MKICLICGESFENHSLYANHMRWVHIKSDKKNLKLAAIKENEKRHGKWIYEKTKCKCGKDIDIKYRENKRKEKYYCSRSCANKKKHTQDTKNKISMSVKNYMVNNPEFKTKCLENLRKDEKRFSSKGEREIRNKLKLLYGDDKVSSHRNICLKNGLYKAVDIYISDRNVIIEYDGIWHFKKVNEKHNFEVQKIKDNLVNEYCIENNIKLIRIKEEVYLKNKDDVFSKILSYINSELVENYIIY